MKDKKGVNIIFACVTIALVAVAVLSMYRNLDRPLVQEAVPDASTTAKLPENHPPLEVSRRLTALEGLSLNNPENADYKTQIGNIYYDLGQYQKAIEYYGASLALKPRNAGVETDMATSYHYLGQEDKALEHLDKVLAYSPGYSRAMFNKGIVLIEGKNDPQHGIAVWEKLLAANPDFPQRAKLEQRIRELRLSGN